MPNQSLLRVAVASAFAAILLVTAGAHAAPRKTLTAFASEQEISDLFKRWAEEARRRDGEPAAHHRRHTGHGMFCCGR